MLKEPNNWSWLRKNVRPWIKKEGVLDVVVFGSAVRGKNTPHDLDICILLYDHQEKKSLDLIHSLSKIMDKPGRRVQINVLTGKMFIRGEDSLAKTLLQEGLSLTTGKPLCANYGLIPASLFLYSLVGFSASQRVRFHYLLRGRKGQPGVLSPLGAELLSDGIISIPTRQEDRFAEILTSWNVKYQIQRILRC